MFATPRKPKTDYGRIKHSYSQHIARKSSKENFKPNQAQELINEYGADVSCHEIACSKLPLSQTKGVSDYTFSTSQYKDPKRIFAHVSHRAPLLPSTPSKSSGVIGGNYPHSGHRALGCDIIPVDAFDLPPLLHRAAQSGCLEEVTKVILTLRKKSESLNTRLNSSLTSSPNGRKNCSNRHSINYQDRHGCSALHYACMADPPSIDIIRALLSGGADPKLLNDSGYLPIQELKSIDGTDEIAEILFILISAGSPVDIPLRSPAFQASSLRFDERGDAHILGAPIAHNLGYSFAPAINNSLDLLQGNLLLSEVCSLTPARPDLVALILEHSRATSLEISRASSTSGDVTDGDTPLHIAVRKYVRERLSLIPQDMMSLEPHDKVLNKKANSVSYTTWPLVLNPKNKNESIPYFWIEWFGMRNNSGCKTSSTVASGIVTRVKKAEEALREYILAFDSFVQRTMRSRAMVILLLVIHGSMARAESPVLALLAKNCEGETVYDLCESEGDLQLLDVILQVWREAHRLLAAIIVKGISEGFDFAIGKWFESCQRSKTNLNSERLISSKHDQAKSTKSISITPSYLYAKADLSVQFANEVISYLYPPEISSQIIEGSIREEKEDLDLFPTMYQYNESNPKAGNRIVKESIANEDKTEQSWSHSPKRASWLNRTQQIAEESSIIRRQFDKLHQDMRPTETSQTRFKRAHRVIREDPSQNGLQFATDTRRSEYSSSVHQNRQDKQNVTSFVSTKVTVGRFPKTRQQM